MSDLGSKSALTSDINAKVTTNGANENTGLRVRTALNNIVDTLDGLKSKNHGEYESGLVVNYRDLITRFGVLYMSVSVTFTTTDWATDEAAFQRLVPDITGKAPAGINLYTGSIVVAGSGESGVNGTYERDGNTGGGAYPRWTKQGGTTVDDSIYFDVGGMNAWIIKSSGVIMYSSGDSALPYMQYSWAEESGSSPAPAPLTYYP